MGIFGAGLIGGSLAKAIRGSYHNVPIICYSRNHRNNFDGIFDMVSNSLKSVAKSANFLVICTPPESMSCVAKAIGKYAKSGTCVTDVCSVKRGIVNEIEAILFERGIEYVGSHPMTGSEQRGFSASRADLFSNSTCVLTPTRRSKQETLQLVMGFWQKLGCQTLVMKPSDHDRAVALCSHLVHIAASSLVNVVLAPGAKRITQKLCASGFRDTTRVASGSAELWREIIMANSKQISIGLGEYMFSLKRIQKAIDKRDEEEIETFLKMASESRELLYTPPGGKICDKHG